MRENRTPGRSWSGAAVGAVLLVTLYGCESRESQPAKAAARDGAQRADASVVVTVDAGQAPDASTTAPDAATSAAESSPDAGAAPSPFAGNTAGPPLSPEERAKLTGTLLYVSERSGQPETYVVRPDGKGEGRIGDGTLARYPGAYSRDGRWLVTVLSEGEGESHLEQLEVWPLSGAGKGRKLGPASSRARNVSLSPDGNTVYFESASQSFSDIFRIGRTGQGLRRLTDSDGSFEPALSPDGRSIVFVSSREGDPELYRMKSDGKQVERLTNSPREDMQPKWSPKGDKIAFLSSRNGTDQVFVMEADGSGTERVHIAASVVTRVGQVEESWEADHAWSPDGTKLAFVARTPGEKGRIWVKDFAAGTLKYLSDGKHRDDSPVFSPDGKTLAFVSDRSGDPELWLMRADGSGAVAVTSSPGADWRPLWLPRAVTK